MNRALIFLLLAVLASCGSPETRSNGESIRGNGSSELGGSQGSQALAETAWIPVQRTLSVMGTELSISALHPDAALAKRAVDAAVVEIQRVEDLATDWRASPLMTLNRAAGDGPHAVPQELADLIERSILASQLTQGAFDPTFRAVGELWDFKAKPPRIPTAAQVQQVLPQVGHDKVKVDVTASTVTRPEGLWIGLGGIAKGYGVDRAMAVLMEHGIENAVVNAGGDLKALGKNGDELWTIAIRHPRDQDRVIAVLPVSNTCVVTSGDYERFFEHDGKRYHHILDPRTGFPSTGAISATVVAPDAAVADALATALCVLPPGEGIALIEQLPRVEAIVVSIDGQVHATVGLSQQSAK
jgi:thiamine biosynthesis lipoprotein